VAGVLVTESAVLGVYVKRLKREESRELKLSTGCHARARSCDADVTTEDDVPLAEPALLFGPNGGGYDDVLALTEDLNSAKYFDCGCSAEGEGLKMIPCGHTIHYSCFKS